MVEIHGTTGFTTVEKIVAPVEIVLAAYGLFLYARIARRLREQHPATWQALGSPALGLSSAPASRLATIRFLFGPACRQLGDAELHRLARRWLGSNAVFIAGLLVLIYQVLRYGP